MTALIALGCRENPPSGVSPPPSSAWGTPSSTKPASRPWWNDVTKTSQVRFIHQTAATGQYLMPEQIGSGCALLDFNNDGRLDLYLLQNGGITSEKSNQLYRQENNGQYRDVTPGSGLALRGRSMGAVVGDVNNDGWNDILVTQFGALHLFLNLQGTGKFKDVSDEAALDNPRWATAAAFLDYDRDGWLDLVVGNYVDYDPTHQCYNAVGQLDFCGPESAPVVASRLYHNRGGTLVGRDKVRFDDVTIASGLVNHPGPALGVVSADFNRDRWPDIFFADDEHPNRLFMNQQDGTFKEEAALRGLAYTFLGQVAADMGIGIGDVNGDGLFDVFITHLTQEFHNLWIQESPGFFQDQTGLSGLAQTAWRGTGFGTVMADFDHDGAVDIALVNGRIKRDQSPDPGLETHPDLAPFWRPYAQRSQLFQNDGTGHFTDISPMQPGFCGVGLVGRGLAGGDLDNDGDIDLVAVSAGGPVQLFHNQAPRQGRHWFMIRAVDDRWGGRDALGAEITLKSGNQTWWRLLQPASSYLSSNDPRVHFGLGNQSIIDSIQVIWPDGIMETFPGGPADRLVLLRRGQGMNKIAD